MRHISIRRARIRKLTAADACAVTALHARCFATAWPESDMLAHISNDIALGYVDDKTLHGFILIRLVRDAAEVLTLAVAPERRGDGLGYELLVSGEKALVKLGAAELFLEVAEDNSSAISLYRRCGFETIGRRPAYYKRAKGRVAAINYVKQLAD